MSSVAKLAPSTPLRAIDGLLRDLDSMFVPPRPLAEPVARARAIAAAIDWSQPTIIIWVPGTSGRDVPESLAEELRRRRAGRAVAMPYQATWRLRESVPDGEATLRALLPLIAARRRAGQRVVLLGESQGAWILSSVMRDPALARGIDRVALIAHPSLAPAHAHDTTSPSNRLDARFREFNDPSDVVSRDVGRSAEAVVDLVDSFARLSIGRAFARVLGIAATNPALVQALIASQLFRVRGSTNPHTSDDRLADAVEWVLSGAPDSPA